MCVCVYTQKTHHMWWGLVGQENRGLGSDNLRHETLDRLFHLNDSITMLQNGE